MTAQGDYWSAPTARAGRVSKIETYSTFGGTRNWLFVRASTDQGLHGWGEASTEFWDSTVAAAVQEMGRRLLGEDALAGQQQWNRLYRHGFWRGGVILQSALAALDQALWDIRGKAVGLPVFRLLGGPTRSEVRTYRHVGIYNPDQLTSEVVGLRDAGVKAYKTGAWVQESALPERVRLRLLTDRLTAIRDLVGPDADILVDNHGRARPDEAIRLINAIAPAQPRWIEEATPPETGNIFSSVASAARAHGISVATGERLYGRWDFRDLFVRGEIDVAQPDLCHAGGITETLKIASMAESFGVDLAPHNPGGPVSTAAAAHVAMAIPNFALLEYCPDEPRRSEITRDPWSSTASALTVPERAGLGIDLDIEAILEVPPHRILVPATAHAGDGSVLDV